MCLNHIFFIFLIILFSISYCSGFFSFTTSKKMLSVLLFYYTFNSLFNFYKYIKHIYIL